MFLVSTIQTFFATVLVFVLSVFSYHCNTMELLCEDEINQVIKQIGFTKALKWSIDNFSDKLIGYLGEHLKLTVKIEPQIELKFFVKCVPRFDKYKAEYLKETAFFTKEFVMLSSLFKQFSKESQKWRPTLLLAKENLFVFEDVTQFGYKMPNNRNVFTLNQVKACVETMARFHAQCYIYEEKKSKELGRPYRVWEDNSDYLKEPVKGRNWRNAGRNAVIEFLKVYSRDRNDPNFMANVDEAITQLYERAWCLLKPHPIYRNAVIHRDLWTNNILFKNVGDSKYHALIVDFQTVLYSSPMMDLSSFMYFNTTRKFRDVYLQEVINLYHCSLSKELIDFNIDINKILDRESLKQSYEECIEFGISQAAIILPITVMETKTREKVFGDPETSLRISEVSRSSEIIEVAKVDKKYLERLTELFDEIVERYVCKSVS